MVKIDNMNAALDIALLSATPTACLLYSCCMIYFN
nr:MAG TPA: hypothetical protein [Caudoviricetes sp.]